MSGRKAAGVDNSARRTWDRLEYKEKADEREKKAAKDDDKALDARKRKRLERDPLKQGLIIQRANLKARDQKLDLTANLNKTQIQSVGMPLAQQAGYYCPVCDCVLKDSISMLDHVNGKWHQRALGMSMRVERSTTEQVKDALERAKQKKKESSSVLKEYVPDGYPMAALEGPSDARNPEDKATDGTEWNQDEEEEEHEKDGDTDELEALMGFGGFGSTKS